MSDRAAGKVELDEAEPLGEDAASRLIAELMTEPPARPPSIIVVGDEAVFGITPPKRSRV